MAKHMHKTKVEQSDNHLSVTLYDTEVFNWDGKIITLRSGGWHTAMTRDRINWAFNELGAPWYATFKDYELYVRPLEFGGQHILFVEGMTIAWPSNPFLEYEQAWPNYCQTCGGTGEVTWTENGAPHGEGFWPMRVTDACDVCEGHCPRCGAAWPGEGDPLPPCAVCGWRGPEDGCPPDPDGDGAFDAYLEGIDEAYEHSLPG